MDIGLGAAQRPCGTEHNAGRPGVGAEHERKPMLKTREALGQPVPVIPAIAGTQDFKKHRPIGRFWPLRCLHTLQSRQVEAVQVHHLVPCRHKVLDKLLLRVRRGIDLGQGAQLGV